MQERKIFSSSRIEFLTLTWALMEKILELLGVASHHMSWVHTDSKNVMYGWKMKLWG